MNTQTGFLQDWFSTEKQKQNALTMAIPKSLFLQTNSLQFDTLLQNSGFVRHSNEYCACHYEARFYNYGINLERIGLQMDLARFSE
jgi:hypothetical protein